MKTCFELNSLAFPVKLEQRANRTFRVTYGKQVTDKLSYTQATQKLGAAIMHALACDGAVESEADESEAND